MFSDCLEQVSFLYIASTRSEPRKIFYILNTDAEWRQLGCCASEKSYLTYSEITKLCYSCLYVKLNQISSLWHKDEIWFNF